MMYTAEKKNTDLLIVGGGLTGLRAAVAALERGRKVTVLSKGPRCSAGVIGFNAAVGASDSRERYCRDILESGQGLSQPELAGLLAEKSDEQVGYLEEKGLRFDRKQDGSYDLLTPLGCSAPRLVHRGTVTGAEEEKIFLGEIERMGGELMTDTYVLDLISDGDTVYGAMAVIGGRLTKIVSNAVIMAAGGGGGLYPITVYPRGICGDSYAIAARAGAELTDMEFVQFEPCCLTKPEKLCGKGISTTLLNAGGRLLNARGESFLSRYFDGTSKMQKDRLSRAIFSEAKACGAPCLYDLRNVPEEEIRAHCLFYKELMQAGMDPKTTLLPVMPAAHTFLGGIKVDGGLRSNLKRLYAAGENLGGLHGANRIGGCAGAETVTFGAAVGESAAGVNELSEEELSRAEELAGALVEEYSAPKESCPEKVKALLVSLRETVGKDLSLVRNERGLLEATDIFERLNEAAENIGAADTKELINLMSLKNMLLTAKLIAKASLERKESRGVFYRSDYPEKNPAWNKSIVLKMR